MDFFRAPKTPGENCLRRRYAFGGLDGERMPSTGAQFDGVDDPSKAICNRSFLVEK